MLRYLIPAVVMVGALVVLLAGALGNLASLPDLGTELSASISRLMPHDTPAPPPDAARAAQPSAGTSTATTEQPSSVTPEPQVTQLQTQLEQHRNELATLRSDEDAARRQLASLQQQRQAEEASVAQLQARHKQLAAIPQPDPAAAAQQQAANAALQKQSDELQAQIEQQSDQLATLRSSEEQERHALDASRQRRQAEEAAVTRLPPQREQWAVGASIPPSRAQVVQPTAPSDHAAATADTTQSVVAELRARQRVVQRPPPAQRPAVSMAQPYSPTQPVLVVSTKGVLVTARELLASGRTADARQLLMRAQAESALHPVTPDQPYATGTSVVASQIGDAIHFLDSGNSGSAMRAINLAMDNVGS
jgi:hypothetical protein